MNQRRTAKMTLKSVVTKTWNDLKPPKTIYNHLKLPTTTYSVEITYTSLGLSENFIMHTPQSKSFQARKSLYK